MLTKFEKKEYRTLGKIILNGSIIDIPEDLFERCKAFVSRRRSLKKRLFIRREDPGLGIIIPEIDNPVAEAGGVPDGVIQLSKG